MTTDNGSNGKKNGCSNGSANGVKQRNKREDNLIPFKPGQSGNPKGRPKGRVSLTAIVREMLAANDGEKAKAICAATVEKAEDGDDKHLREIWNRVDGKVPDRIAGHDGGPLIKEVSFELDRL